MSFWFHNGSAWDKARMARADLGADVYLCCPGPSLKKAVIARGPGTYIAALTKAYPQVRPDIWFGLDTPACYDRRVWAEGFVKVARGCIITPGGPRGDAMTLECLDGISRPIRGYPNVLYADLVKMAVHETFARRGNDAPLIWCKDTLTAALHALVIFGAKRIHLVGADLRSPGPGEPDWCIGKTLSPELKGKQTKLFKQQVERLRQFAIHGKTHGVELISCTEGSPINEHIPYVPLAEALAKSRSHLPTPGEIMHSREQGAAGHLQGHMAVRPVPEPQFSAERLSDGTICFAGAPYPIEIPPLTAAAFVRREGYPENYCGPG